MIKDEAGVKREVVDVIKKLDVVFSWAPPGGAFGLAGMSDRMFIYRGVLFAVECKYGSNKPTTAQLSVLKRVVRAGGVSIVYYGGMKDDLLDYITECDKSVENRACVIGVFKNGDVRLTTVGATE